MGMQGGIRDKRGLQLPTRRGRRALSGFFDEINAFDKLKWSLIIVLLLVAKADKGNSRCFSAVFCCLRLAPQKVGCLAGDKIDTLIVWWPP